MAHSSQFDRREFVRKSAAAVTGFSAAGSFTACAGPEAIEEAARSVGMLSRRKLPQCGREITVLIGAGSWDKAAIEAGIRCGVNYWHAVNEWQSGDVPQAILRNREAHYCQICVDRVRGNHETGDIDDEEHCRFVREAVRRTGLRYFDDMQFHFGYHSVAEVKSNPRFVRAFERLKKEGLVRHLCMSQHSYKGNSRVPDGENAAEILTAVAEQGLFEHGQFIYSYGDSPSINEFVALARRKGFGTIAMKTTRGAGRMQRDAAFMKKFPPGTTPYHALARWLTTQTELNAAVIQISSLREFVDTCSGAGKAMRASDTEAVREMTAYANREVCRLCNECLAHCERNVPIADILRFERYAVDYGARDRARRLYGALDLRADACTRCGTCTARCSQGMDIARKLARAHALLS